MVVAWYGLPRVIMEEWRQFDVFEVSNLGNVRCGGSPWKVGPCGKYSAARKVIGRVLHRFYVHRMVAEAFHGKPPAEHEVNHIDGNKFNNRADNLEWVTHKANTMHAGRTGLMPRGARNPISKLRRDQVNLVRQLYKFGGCLQREIGAVFGISQTCVGHLLRGNTWSYVPR